MKRKLLAICAVGFAAAALLFAYVGFMRSPALVYAQILGTPGDHSPHRRLAELPLDLVFDQTRSRIVSRQEDGRIVAWGLKGGTPRLIARTDSLFGYCRAGQMLIVSEGDQAALLDLGSKARRPIAGGPYHHVAWSADCSRFALAGEESKTIEIWRSGDPARLAVAETTSPVRNGLAMSDDGRYVAAAQGSYSHGQGHKTNLEVFAISRDGGVARTAAFYDPDIIVGMWRMVFASAARSLIVGSQTKARSGLRSLTLQGGEVNWGHDGFASYWVRGLAVSPNGELLVSGDEMGKLRGWDAPSGRKLFQQQTGLVIQSIAFSRLKQHLFFAYGRCWQVFV